MSNTFKPFWDAHGYLLKPFFWSWDITNFADDVYFVRFKKGMKYDTPLNLITELDHFVFDMEGIVEE